MTIVAPDSRMERLPSRMDAKGRSSDPVGKGMIVKTGPPGGGSAGKGDGEAVRGGAEDEVVTATMVSRGGAEVARVSAERSHAPKRLVNPRSVAVTLDGRIRLGGAQVLCA